MKILVVAATELEIDPFMQMSGNKEVLITGAGIPSTVYHLTKKLLQERYDAVIQAGIAGSFSKKIKNGEVVIVEQDTFADIGVEENKKFKTLFDLGLSDENTFPFKNGWLVNDWQVLQSTGLKKVKAVTINKINDSKKQTKYLKKRFDADIESMEGAAFHFVCLQQGIPFLQIRSISNRVGERDKSKWDMKNAIEKLSLEIKKLVYSINKQ